jgi:hypothetical protein
MLSIITFYDYFLLSKNHGSSFEVSKTYILIFFLTKKPNKILKALINSFLILKTPYNHSKN